MGDKGQSFSGFGTKQWVLFSSSSSYNYIFQKHLPDEENHDYF
jgi:hypothetical protein